MKSVKWMPALGASVLASPAWAASELATGKMIVWIALGVVFIGALAALLGSLIIFNGNRDASQDDV
ncbi:MULTISPECIES: hypothetical protein [unclassified Brevundimonas]|uniref:hypothetical protein n=1 Tax=unclassified Brevundimonas TaxID=2622653 RepID=UPI0025C34847|nr:MULTISPECIES: hypothetical protein [unclassified Brevundimonas]